MATQPTKNCDFFVDATKKEPEKPSGTIFLELFANFATTVLRFNGTTHKVLGKKMSIS